MKNYIKPFLIVFLLIIVVYFLLQNNSIIKTKNIEETKKEFSFIKIKDIILSVEIADTFEKRSLGLGKRDFLLENHAMLFSFEQKGKYFFWMKDMNFPIDIIWFDENQKIIFIEQKINPNSYPKLFGGELESKYVLETVSGFVEKNQIKIGDSFVFIDN